MADEVDLYGNSISCVTQITVLTKRRDPRSQQVRDKKRNQEGIPQGPQTDNVRAKDIRTSLTLIAGSVTAPP